MSMATATRIDDDPTIKTSYTDGAGPSAASAGYATGDRVAITRLMAPEDLPVGSLGTVRTWDNVCTGMVIIDWDAGWTGLYHPQHISKA